MKSNVVVLKNYQITKDPGRHHRLLCMTGDRRGEVYYLKSKRILLGRSKSADIKVFDQKSSREHAELLNVKGEYIITDLGSNNGIVINGEKVNQVPLKNKDRLIIGKTVYKYEIQNIAEPELKLVNKGQEEESPKDNKRKNIALIVLGLVVAFVFLTDEEKKQPARRVQMANDLSNDFVKLQKQRQFEKDKVVSKKLDVIVQRGIRELREGNYYRAINEFDMALILSPQNSRALSYKEKAQKSLDDDIDKFFALAARDYEAFNYAKAIKSYCAVIKMLEYKPDDDRKKSAEKNIEEITNKSGIDKSESSCQ